MHLDTSEMEFGDVRTIRTSGVGPGLGTQKPDRSQRLELVIRTLRPDLECAGRGYGLACLPNVGGPLEA